MYLAGIKNVIPISSISGEFKDTGARVAVVCTCCCK